MTEVVLAGALGLVTGLLIFNLQTRREKTAWERDSRQRAYTEFLLAFQQSVSRAAKLSLEKLVVNLARAGSGESTFTKGDDLVDELTKSLEEAEQRLGGAHMHIVLVGTNDVFRIVRRMTSITFVAGTLARKGMDTGSLEWETQVWGPGRQLRTQYVEEARKSMGIKAPLIWDEPLDTS